MKKIAILLLFLVTPANAQDLEIKFNDNTKIVFRLNSLYRNDSSLVMNVEFFDKMDSSGYLKFELGDGYCNNEGGILKMYTPNGSITYLPWDKTTINITSTIAHVFCDVMGYTPQIVIPKHKSEIKKSNEYNRNLG